MNRYILHFGLFAVSKSAVLFAPILAATVLSQSNYGLLEWSLSFAMMLSIFLSLGAGGVLSFEIIKHESSTLIDTTLFYIVFLSFLISILGGIGVIFFDSPQFSYILGFTGVFIGQFSLSAYLKAKGKGAYSSIIESLVYIIILLLVLNSILQEIKFLKHILLFPLASIILSITLLLIISDKKATTKKSIKLFLQRGSPIMLSSFMAIGFINLPRVVLGYYSLDDVASFSLYFRWAAIALVAYQFILVIKFRQIYSYSYDRLDRYIVSIGLLVLLAGFLIIAGIMLLEKYNIKLYLAVPAYDILIQSLMAFGVTLWATSTSLEGLFYRENLSRLQIYSSGFGIVSFLLSIMLIKDFVSNPILSFSFSWFISYIVIVLLQIFYLKRYLNIYFYHIAIFVFGIGTSAIVLLTIKRLIS